MFECRGLWYIRWFTGNWEGNTPSKSEWDKGNDWRMDEFKNIAFTVTPFYIAESNYLYESMAKSKWLTEVLQKERDIEWIGAVSMVEESGRMYTAESRKWENKNLKAGLSVWLKKRAGEWHIIDTFRAPMFGVMPKLSCKEIDRLKK